MAIKVLIICQNFYPEIGSAANRMKNIYLELEKRGYEVTVLTSEPSYPNRNLYKDSKFWQDNALERNIIRFSTRTRKYNNNIFNRLLLYLEMCFKIVSKINRLDKEYDMVFATTPTIFVGLTGLFAKWKLRSPLILDVRDLWPESLLGVGVFTFKPVLSLAYFLEKKLYRGAKHIIVNSEGFIPHIVAKGVDRRVISFMPNSLTNEELIVASTTKNRNKEQITVIYTGNIGLAQDLNILIEVAERMKDSAIKFKIIGYGYRSQELKKQIESKKLRNVEWIKAKNRKEAVEATGSADIAFVSLVNEKVFDTVLPGKIIDYMCMGKPIVGAVSGHAADVIERSRCGYVSKTRCSEEIQNYIVELAENELLRKKLGENGSEYAYQNYRWEENIRVLTKVLEREYEEKSMHVCVESFHQ